MFLTVILVVAAIVCIGLAIAVSRPQDSRRPDGISRPSGRPFWIGAAVLGIAAVLSMGFRIIPAGHVGVVTWFGEVENRTLQPGAQFVVPIAENIVEVDTRVRGVYFDQLAAASEEYQDVFITGTLNIHIDSTGAEDLYQRVGLDYQTKLVEPFLATTVKEIVPEYQIDEILLRREEIRQRVVEKLGDKLDDYHIIVDDIAMTQISFSEAYTNAIEEKQVQEQRVLTEQQILEQRRIQAEQQIVQAEGEAQSAIERATGEAEANRLLSESLSDPLITYTSIQRLNDNINIVMVPADGGFILDVGNLAPADGAGAEPTPAPAP